MARFWRRWVQPAGRAELPVQVAAVCYRVTDSSLEFLLVNTSSGKWTFPKGGLNPKMSPSENAACEAREEAGAKGRIAETPFASYVDFKRASGQDNQAGEVRIMTYLLEVERTTTPLESGRNPRWFSALDARPRLAEGRSPRYARQIVRIIDSAVESLMYGNKLRDKISESFPADAERRALQSSR